MTEEKPETQTEKIITHRDQELRSVLKLICTNKNILKIPAKEINWKNQEQREDVLQLVQRMKDVAYRLEMYGDRVVAGLAANQVSSQLPVIILRHGKRRGNQRSKFRWMVSPEILQSNGPMVESTESCFSLPGQEKTVQRYSSVVVRCTNKMEPIRLKGPYAIALQHEINHLQGLLI